MSVFLEDGAQGVTPIWLVTESQVDQCTARMPPAMRAVASGWLRGNGFRAERGRVLLLPTPTGDLAGVLLGIGRMESHAELSPQHVSVLPERLPSGAYALADALPPASATAAAIGWGMGSYRFERYKTPGGRPPVAQLVMPKGADADEVKRVVAADLLARDLINTPAGDLGPSELAQAVARVANQYGGDLRVIVGDELLSAGFPLIHAVGRAAAAAPRLIELRYGSRGPEVCIVGKGVCFDSGGLDLKPASAMALMKKDMGGAACALALTQLVMAARLPIRLRLLIPAVENAVSGDAFRPGDIIRSRKGLYVEVNNTDAEGRLVLADAISYADEARPELILDFATLTGAARIALGPELPALFASSDVLAAEVEAAAHASMDPLWRLPLHAPYEEDLASKVADLSNVSSSAFAGAIVGALFLRRFVSDTTPWAHIDLYAWNPKERPGRPIGGEMQAVRALWQVLRARYA
jgi:leucyl aminopeptidase